MGFELDESADERVTVTVGVGKNPSYLAILTPGAFVPALKGVHCLPTLPLTYDEVRLSCTGDSSKLRVVQAVLSREGQETACREPARSATAVRRRIPRHRVRHLPGMGPGSASLRCTPVLGRCSAARRLIHKTKSSVSPRTQ